jgi:ankyrin repeat protein
MAVAILRNAIFKKGGTRRRFAMKYPETYEEIRPLVDLIKAGKLFEVQEWIASGKPLNLPLVHEKKTPRASPLSLAIDLGFHSLVKVLLDGGADLEDSRYPPLEHAIHKRRLDLVKLLVEKGAKIRSIDITSVFASWYPEIVEYFVENGADLVTGNPVAWALCAKIRPALGILKRYQDQDRFPILQEQANIALRRHSWDGNLKWVSLMLWAGADPYSKGPDSPEGEPDPENDLNALEGAAFHGHLDIFKLRPIRLILDPKRPDARKLIEHACYAENSNLLKWLLEKGFNTQDWDDKGASLIQSLLSHMTFDWHYNPFIGEKKKQRDIDGSRSREEIKMIHLLARYGAKWEPGSERDINQARRSLLKMTPDYTAEFVWIMSKYKACSKKSLEQLIRPAPIRILVEKYQTRIDELMKAF